MSEVRAAAAPERTDSAIVRAIVNTKRSPIVVYGVAVVGVAVAFLLRWAIYGSLDNRLPFAFFLPATMIAAWYGGLGPGLLAAGMGLLLGDYFFLPPHVAWGPMGEAERTAIAIYALTSTLSVVLFDNLHVRIRRLECELRERDAGSADAGGGA